MLQNLKIGIRFNCEEDKSHEMWQYLIGILTTHSLKIALIDLSGSDLLFNAIECSLAENREEIYHSAPRITPMKCKFCGICIDLCANHAIYMNKGSGKIYVEPEACTDCGQCYNACSAKGAILKSEYLSGLIEWTDKGENLRIFRVAFRKKWLLQKKGLPRLEKLCQSFPIHIYGIEPNYCGKSFELKMNHFFEIDHNTNKEELVNTLLKYL